MSATIIPPVRRRIFDLRELRQVYLLRLHLPFVLLRTALRAAISGLVAFSSTMQFRLPKQNGPGELLDGWSVGEGVSLARSLPFVGDPLTVVRHSAWHFAVVLPYPVFERSELRYLAAIYGAITVHVL